MPWCVSATTTLADICLGSAAMIWGGCVCVCVCVSQDLCHTASLSLSYNVSACIIFLCLSSTSVSFSMCSVPPLGHQAGGSCSLVRLTLTRASHHTHRMMWSLRIRGFYQVHQECFQREDSRVKTSQKTPLLILFAGRSLFFFFLLN